MIQKLRKQFIVINMSLVSLVLIIVFIILGVSSYSRLASDSREILRKSVERREGGPPKEMMGEAPPKKQMPILPVFTVTANAQGVVTEVTQENLSVDLTFAQEAVTKAIGKQADEGILFDEALRFLIQETEEGYKAAFVDMQREYSQMTDLFISSLAAGIGALLAFYFISVYLAELALKPVEQAWIQQRQFVADASHELKTPLTVILANTGILMSHRGDTIDNQIKWIENTQSEAERMKLLIEDLLFLARSEMDQQTVDHDLVSLSDITWQCLLPLESIAFEAGVKLESHIMPDIMARCSPSQVKQLLIILLDNAIKYAGSSGQVSVTLRKVDQQAVWTFSNSGQSIPATDLPHIFDRFYRADESRARNQGGYGLGLAIAKTIVERHKGHIQVSSSEKEGTHFKVTLPGKV